MAVRGRMRAATAEARSASAALAAEMGWAVEDTVAMVIRGVTLIRMPISVDWKMGAGKAKTDTTTKIT